MLPVLIQHGFAPLAQPALRAVLAPTVTLAQALKIRGLNAERERELLRSLAAVATEASGDARAPGDSSAPDDARARDDARVGG